MRTALAGTGRHKSARSRERPSAPPTPGGRAGGTIASCGGISTTQTIANLKTLDAPLRLPPSHRKLDFEFTALSFSAPENTHFRFRLDGLDNNWVDAETRSASYSRLVEAKYEFRVEASSGNGPWNE